MNADILLNVLILLVICLTVAVVMLLKRQRPPTADPVLASLPVTLQNLAHSIQQSHGHAAVLSEKISRLESLAPAVHGFQVDVRTLAERMSGVESRQSQAQQYLQSVTNGLTHAGALTQTLVEATSAIRNDLQHARTNLTDLQSQAKSRHEIEQRTSDSIRRLEAVIAGTHSKGAAGENILEAVFSKLPTDWQIRNFQVNGRTCEFGLRLPNNLVMPIDSKWAATHLLEQFMASNDLGDQQRLKAQIEKTVLFKAGEVRKYIDTNKTVSFGIAAVPDAIYDLCSATLCEAFDMNVIVISYSMFIPYLLLVFQTTLKTSQNIDLEKLDRDLRFVYSVVTDLEKEVEGRWSTAITMLSNGRDGMRTHLAKLRHLPSLQPSGDRSTTAANLTASHLDLGQGA